MDLQERINNVQRQIDDILPTLERLESSPTLHTNPSGLKLVARMRKELNDLYESKHDLLKKKLKEDNEKEIH